MDQATANRLCDRLNDNGYEATLYDGYSGRGMFGKETWGVSVDSHPDDIPKRLLPRKGFRFDNLGLKYIIY